MNRYKLGLQFSFIIVRQTFFVNIYSIDNGTTMITENLRIGSVNIILTVNKIEYKNN